MKPARSRQEIAPAPLAAARIVKARLSRHASGVPQRRDEADGMVLDVGPCLVGQGQAGPMLQRPRQVGEGAVHDAGGQRKAAPAEQQDADLAAGIADGGQALAAQVAVEADVEQQPAACLVGYRGGLVGKAERLETEVSNRHLEQCRIQLLAAVMDELCAKRPVAQSGQGGYSQAVTGRARDGDWHRSSNFKENGFHYPRRNLGCRVLFEC